MRTSNVILLGLGFGLVIFGLTYATKKVIEFNNNNPTNIKRSSDMWVGMSPQQTDPKFVQFSDVVYGIRAAARNLRTYFSKGLNTVEKIISTWAPKEDNNDTAAYIQDVANTLGVSPTAILTNNESTLFALIKVIIKHEMGFNPYSDTTVLTGIRMP